MKNASSQAFQNLPFLSHLRYLMILFVLVIHVCFSYTNIFPGWFIKDSASHKIFDIIMLVSDIFVLPVLFFIAGFFALPSLKRKGPERFLKDKLKRLGIPFVLGVIIVAPPMLYLNEYQHITWNISFSTYGNYWIEYLKSPVSLYVGPITQLAQFRPFHFWFISMLLIFFVIFCLLYKISAKWFPPATMAAKSELTSSTFMLILLLMFGLVTSIGFFAINSISPDYHWLTIGTLLTLQPTRVVLYICYFVLGLYAFSKQWFIKVKAPSYSTFWSAFCALLLIGYYLFCIEGKWISIPGNTFAYALIRSFLCLSFLMTFILFGFRFWNRSSKIDKAFSANSYIIYQIHMTIVVMLQFLFTFWKNDWQGVMGIKFGSVTLLSIAISYSISAYIIKPTMHVSAGLIRSKALRNL